MSASGNCLRLAHAAVWAVACSASAAHAGAAVGILSVQATVPDLCRISSGSHGATSLRCTSARSYLVSTAISVPSHGARTLSQTREGEMLVVTVSY